jgi:hypothetical protein
MRDSSVEDFATSTEYWEYVLTNRTGAVGADFSIFGGEGIPKCHSRDPEEFAAENNAWCVVSDVNSIEMESAPFFFTRNVHLSRLGSGIRKEDVFGKPFGSRGAVVVTRNCKIIVLEGMEEVLGYFSALTYTNAVLRP